MNDSRLAIAAIRFLNPAPLMWDFEHEPHASVLAARFRIDWMLPAACADRLANGSADIGLVPIAALPLTPGLRIVPGCTIASKGAVRSLLLVRRARQEPASIRTVAADTASRTTIAYSRLLFRIWGNPGAQFVPMAPDLDTMLAHTDAAVVIGDAALLALEEQVNRLERTGEELVYHDIAHEWRMLTGLPFVSAVWAIRGDCRESLDRIASDLIASRDHGLAHIEALAEEWSRKLPLTEEAIRSYLTDNIHYILDEECLNGMLGFYQMAAESGVLPKYALSEAVSLVRR